MPILSGYTKWGLLFYNIMEEYWKNINNNYEISSKGVVRNINTKEYSNLLHSKNGLRVNIGTGGFVMVHDLVAKIFVDKMPYTYNVFGLHKNGNVYDNRVENIYIKPLPEKIHISMMKKHIK